MAKAAALAVLLAPCAQAVFNARMYVPCSAPEGVTPIDQCSKGIIACEYCEYNDLFKDMAEKDPQNYNDNDKQCANTVSEHANPQGHVVILVFGAIVGCAMAFGIGGNDAANSWGTSVGSNAIGLRKATLIGGFMEMAGATLLGAGVSSTVQKGVAALTGPGSEDCWACGFCNSQMAIYQFGMFSALCGAALFLLGITVFGLPVSTTHAIVGGVVGMTWVAVGGQCLNWSIKKGLGAIVLSWVASPLFSGIVGSAMYLLTYFAVFKQKNPVQAAYVTCPLLYGFTSGTMIYLILLKSSVTKKTVSPMIRLIAAIIVTVVVPVLVYLLVLPGVKKRIAQEEEEEKTKKTEEASGAPAVNGEEDADRDSDEESDSDDDEPQGMALCAATTPTRQQELAKLVFQNLLVFNAALESFAHGANDTANATGPFGALYSTFLNGQYACGSEATPWWIMLIAGFFVFIGVNTMGKRVIKTMGEEICAIDFHIGYCVEFASGFSVVVATLIGMPVSTTHCQVGAVVFVGALAAGVEGVKWGMFGKIALTWVATLPFSGGLSGLMVYLRFFT